MREKQEDFDGNAPVRAVWGPDLSVIPVEGALDLLVEPTPKGWVRFTLTFAPDR